MLRFCTKKACVIQQNTIFYLIYFHLFFTGDASCPEGWEELSEFCLSRQNNAVDQSTAAETCKKLGGRIAPIQYKDRYKLLEDFL